MEIDINTPLSLSGEVSFRNLQLKLDEIEDLDLLKRIILDLYKLLILNGNKIMKENEDKKE